MVENPQGTLAPLSPFVFECRYADLIASAEGSLQRLNTDRLDILLLHWPDLLIRPEEVAQAFDELHRAGKVRYFGVSNHTSSQVDLLRNYLCQPLVVNQVELGLGRADKVGAGLAQLESAGMCIPQGHAVFGDLVDYCRLHHMQIQAWSPVTSFQTLVAASSEPIEIVERLLARHNVTAPAIALAWLLHHPASIVPITGTTQVQHLIENCRADTVQLTDDQWYQLYFAVAWLQNQDKTRRPCPDLPRHK